jgi:hypothetical protein
MALLPALVKTLCSQVALKDVRNFGSKNLKEAKHLRCVRNLEAYLSLGTTKCVVGKATHFNQTIRCKWVDSFKAHQLNVGKGLLLFIDK